MRGGREMREKGRFSKWFTVVTYEIEVTTGNKRGAGTDADVKISSFWFVCFFIFYLLLSSTYLSFSFTFVIYLFL